ncbi:hypothetical protein EEB19_24365 [Gordonia sp. OPL2]|nr:hypothetical protein EEB19_24365 [Gordonia sp. OPL2]
MTIRGELELRDTEPFEYRDDDSGTAHWMWQGLLRGYGWTATWTGPRPLTGPVELTGYFGSSLNHDDEGRVRGRITRVQIISQVSRCVGDTMKLADDTACRYREVELAPFSHHDAEPCDIGGVQYRDIATLIDLDLDDVPPRTLRPQVLPGHVSSADAAVWVADSELPIVARIDTTTDHATEYVLPGRGDTYRRVAATPSGCWVTGRDALYRITHGAGASRVTDDGACSSAVSGETLLAQHVSGGWMTHTPDGPPLPVDVPADELIGNVGIDSSTGDFISLMRWATDGGRWLRLVRVSPTGDVRVGPGFAPPDRRGGRPFFAETRGLRMFYGGVVVTINDDLTLGPPDRLPKEPIIGGAFADRAWILTFRARRFSDDLSTQWWPLPAPIDPSTPLPSDALLTILDPTTLTPQTSRFVDQPRSVAAQPRDAWICDRGRLLRMSLERKDSDGEAAIDDIDISTLITESISPATTIAP